MTSLQKPGSPEELVLKHYGVKGMKWGIQGSNPDDTQNARYSVSERTEDRETFGNRGEKRINRRINKGKTRKQAVRKEKVRQLTKAFVVMGSAAAYLAIKVHGPAIASSISARAETNRGRDAALSIMTPLVPKKRHGAYNITTM